MLSSSILAQTDGDKTASLRMLSRCGMKTFLIFIILIDRLFVLYSIFN